MPKKKKKTPRGSWKYWNLLRDEEKVIEKATEKKIQKSEEEIKKEIEEVEKKVKEYVKTRPTLLGNNISIQSTSKNSRAVQVYQQYEGVALKQAMIVRLNR